MRIVFSLFLRLFICFVAVKLFLRFIGWDSVKNLIILTLLCLGNIYWFDFLDYREMRFNRRRKRRTSGQKPEGEVSPNP